MGNINLLRADYVGKVGQTYGVRQFRESIVKAIPFSHTPHNATQRRSVRAFEKLNRFSAYVARTFWRYLNLSDKKMYKHNAVAKWFSPAVKNHSFELENLNEIIPSNDTLSFGNVSFDFDSRIVTVDFVNSPYSNITTRENIFIALVTDNGTVKSGGVFSSVSQTVNLAWDITDFVSLSVVMFKSSVQNNKKIVNGFCIRSEQSGYVVDGILYTSRLPLVYEASYSDGYIVFNSVDAEVVDNILHFLNT